MKTRQYPKLEPVGGGGGGAGGGGLLGLIFAGPLRVPAPL